MAYYRTELEAMVKLLKEMDEAVAAVMFEGDEYEEFDAKWGKREPQEFWHHIRGTKATGHMRRKSMELTRALADLRRP